MGATRLHFDWDESNIHHLARHKVMSEEAEQVIRNDPFEVEDDFRSNERRYQFLGETDAERILIVVATVEGEAVRVITAWPAKRRLKAFWRTLAKGAKYGEKGE